jgi:hypothetical protein
VTGQEGTAVESIDIIKAVLGGDADDNLDGVMDAVRDRQKLAGRAQFHELHSGDRVRLVNVRPRYLVGAPATIIEKKQTRISIKIDEEWLDRNPQAKARWSGSVTAPANMLERVS